MSNPLHSSLADQRLIIDCGVDYESRPMLLVSACRLPDPNKQDYDILLQTILNTLDEYVENDYVVILLTAQTIHKPSARWVLKAYRALSRKYRKNLKALYIVHPSTWLQWIIKAMQLIISPKFAKKLHNVQTLSQLASLVPFRQLSIPDQVYEYNLTLEPSVTIPSPPTNLPKDDRVFGRPLQDLMSEIDETRLAIPPIIDHCFGFIRQYGMKTEGIFRRSPSSVELKYVKAEFNRGQLPDFNRYSSPVHLAAVTIKMFLRELPWPLLPSECYPSLQEHYGLDKGACNTEQKANYFVDEFLPLMSGVPCERILLLYMLRFFGEELCINHEHTKMTPTNIGIVFGPNLVRCGDDIVKELELSRCASQFIKDAVESWALIKTHSIR